MIYTWQPCLLFYNNDDSDMPVLAEIFFFIYANNFGNSTHMYFSTYYYALCSLWDSLKYLHLAALFVLS